VFLKRAPGTRPGLPRGARRWYNDSVVWSSGAAEADDVVVALPRAATAHRFRAPTRLATVAGVVATIALAISFVGLVKGFGALGAWTRDSIEVHRWDHQIVDALRAPSRSPIRLVMQGVTLLGAWPVLIVAAVALVVATCTRRVRIAPALFVTTVAVGGELAVLLIKELAPGPRPSLEDEQLWIGAWSFPSGHTATAFFVYVGLAILVCSHARSGFRRALIASGAVATAFVVSFSRVELGVHAPSEVLAGAALALTWLTAVAIAALVVRGVAPAHWRRASARG
jgi:undecaprenyl-diphosphatase